MKIAKRIVLSTILALALGACSSSGDDPVVVVPPPPPPPPPPASTDFTTFVKDQFANTSDMTDPEDVDNEDFTFSDNDDPSAYDDLLQ